MMNETTAHPAAIPEHAVNVRWVSCQIAGA
jgi:hypothetical protein